MQILLFFLKYWKTGGIILLTAAFLISFHLARSRGEKLDMATQTLGEERQKFQSQIKMIEKAREDDKNRNDFRAVQTKKIRLAAGAPAALDAAVRDAYDSLRARQSEHGTAR